MCFEMVRELRSVQLRGLCFFNRESCTDTYVERPGGGFAPLLHTSWQEPPTRHVFFLALRWLCGVVVLCVCFACQFFSGFPRLLATTCQPLRVIQLRDKL